MRWPQADPVHQASWVTIALEPYAAAGDLAPHDLAALNRIHNEAWAGWVAGERPMTDDAFAHQDRFSAHPERMERMLARDATGAALGFGVAFWREGPGGCTVRLFVGAAHRGAGVGSALGAALAGEARRAGRDGVNVEVAVGSPVEAALRSIDGMRAGLAVELNRARTEAIDRGLLERWRKAGEGQPGYTMVAYDAPCPSDGLARDFVRARDVMNDAPRPEGEAAATYTTEELRAVETAAAAAHQDWWNVGIRHDASGELIGLSDLYLPAARPWAAYQGDTGVRPDHRGLGLGAWMKAVNHLRLADERPQVEWVQTWNASSNEPMLRINRALGFAPVQRFQNWYLPFAR